MLTIYTRSQALFTLFGSAAGAETNSELMKRIADESDGDIAALVVDDHELPALKQALDQVKGTSIEYAEV